MKKDLDRKWMCSLDVARWEAVNYFDTKEEAMMYGAQAIEKFNKNPEEEYLDDEMGSTPDEVVKMFYVGQIFCPGIPFNVDDLIEQVQEDAYDDGNECAEDYLVDVTKEDKEELEELVLNWFNKHNYLPTWWSLSNMMRLVWFNSNWRITNDKRNLNRISNICGGG